MRGHASAWSPKRSTVPRQPWGGPQVLLCRGRGCRRRHLKAICIAIGGSVVAGSVGIAASHAPACGPSWDRKSAWELGGMSGSVLRVRVAHLPSMRPVSGPCVVGWGRAHPVQQGAPRGACLPACLTQQRPCFYRLAQTRGVSARSPFQSLPAPACQIGRTSSHDRQRICPRSPARGRRCALRGLEAAEHCWQRGYGPRVGRVVKGLSSKASLQRFPDGCIVRSGVPS